MAAPLVRDPKRRMLAGVAAGIADHLNVDPLLIRLAFILLAFLHGVGVLLYVIAWVAIPLGPQQAQGDGAPSGSGAGSETAGGPAPGAAAHAERFADELRETGRTLASDLRSRTERAGGGRRMLGIVLIVLGGLFLLDRFSWWRWPRWASLWNLWPLALIAGGAFMIFGGRHKEQP